MAMQQTSSSRKGAGVQGLQKSTWTKQKILFHCTRGIIWELKQITTAGATMAAVTEKVWGEYVAVVCQILKLSG